MFAKRFVRSNRLLLFVTLALSLWCSNTSAQNLLSNPGFEEVGNDGIPVSWQREHNAVLSGPFTVVEDAHEGKRAACMMTEEWNYERPQFITQTVKVPAGAKTLRLSAYCKGQGMVNLAFRFLKGGEPVQKEKVNFGFGDVEKPVEALNCFALCQTYDLYEAFAKVPEGADGVVVKLGNTIPPLERLNIWGKAWIDAASLTASTEDAPATQPTHQLTDKLTLPPGYQDIAPAARLVLQPTSFEPAKLIDGDTETTAGFMGGVDRGGTVNLLFANAAPVHSVNLYLWGNVTALVVRGDGDGDGVYETVLGRSQGLSGKGWLVLPLEQKPVKGIRIQPLAGELCGFRQVIPFTTEIKVLAATKDAATLCPPGWGSLARIALPTRAGTPLSLRPTAMALPELKKPRFRRMVCADLWMWGVNASTKDCKLADYRNNPAFQHTAEMCKRMGVEGILVDLTGSSCSNLMPWPSKVCNGTVENHLKALIDALHAEGFEVFVEIIHNVTPFETIKWHYPEEETSRYPGMKQYPSIIHGNHVRDNWLAIMDEIMACGADGVGLSSDEQYYKGHFMETFPKDDPARELYRKRFGYDLPEHEEDSLKFRQWIQMRHEGVCDLFGYWSQQLKKKHPKIYTNTMLMSYACAYSYLTETGVPVDLLGARGGITEIGSDYMGPYGIRMAAAANGWRQATMLHNGDMWPYPPAPDMHFYSTALWNLMCGAGSVNYWRFNYVVDYGHASALTRAYSMVKELDALGLWDARPSRKITLLSSRASIDWWQIKAWWGKHADPNWDRGLEAQRGWFADECAFNLLQRNGYAFDWLFLDHPEQLTGLDQSKVLVIPFAYSVSKEAAARIKLAAGKGAKVILLSGMQGPTDEWGEPHPAPALKELADSGKAVVFDDDILAFGSSTTLASKLIKALDDALGPEHPFKLHHYGQSIDATMLEKGDRERFVFLINYEKRPSTVDIEMALPEGKYEAFARDDNRWYSVSPPDGGKLSHEQLRHFRLILAREQPYVLHIRKAK